MALRGIAMAKKLRLKKMELFRPLVCILAIANPVEYLNCFLIWNETSTFNKTVLNKYYDQLFKELVKLFEEHSEAVYCFHGGEYVYGGHDWLSGKYWRVTLSQSIRYADGIILAQ